ncbi:oxidoreductase-like domain-containing protein [Rhodanobacter sp. Root627]|uniref:oxidoreductase-like domain-containing protein n=1 Tax=Rhodanobacter sp. Root627 TaxID=1736572 RepID=UPI0009E83ECD|nr:oxidoreductase-like domain-containing protein [Rhodanobacter sp. Root627]
MTHDPAGPSDPPPIPPVAPDPGDCCGEGCVRCVHDVYEASLERYRMLLEAWQARHPDDGDGRGPSC